MKKIHTYAGAALLLCIASLNSWAKSVQDLPYTDLDYNRPASKAIRKAIDKLYANGIPEKIMAKAVKKLYANGIPDNKETVASFSSWYEGYVVSSYIHILEELPMDSPTQQRVIAEQKRYLERRDACGEDLQCIYQTEKSRLDALNAMRKKLERPLPDAEIRKLTRGWKVDGKSLYQRLVEGFSIYPLRQVTLSDGRSIQWGFLPHAAQIQSVAVLSPKGKIEALATADDLYLSKGKDTQAQLRIYLPHPQDLASLGALRSWAAASLLGFNQSCQGAEQAACTQALRKLPPIAVYDLHCKAKTPSTACRIPVEIGPGSAKDISLFWQ